MKGWAGLVGWPVADGLKVKGENKEKDLAETAEIRCEELIHFAELSAGEGLTPIKLAYDLRLPDGRLC